MVTVALRVRQRKMGAVVEWCRANGVPVLIRHRRSNGTGNDYSLNWGLTRFAGGEVFRAPNRPSKSLRSYIAVLRPQDELVFQLRWGPFPAIPHDAYRKIIVARITDDA